MRRFVISHSACATRSASTSPSVRSRLNGRVTVAMRVCPRDRRCSVTCRMPRRSSMPTDETSSRICPSTTTAGIPRRRSAASIGSSVMPPHMSTATSIAAVSSSGSTADPAGRSDPGISRTPRFERAERADEPVEHLDRHGVPERAAQRVADDDPDDARATAAQLLTERVRARSSPARRRRRGPSAGCVEAIGPAPENARDAVDTETPAADATSASVGRVEDRAGPPGRHSNGSSGWFRHGPSRGCSSNLFDAAASVPAD